MTKFDSYMRKDKEWLASEIIRLLGTSSLVIHKTRKENARHKKALEYILQQCASGVSDRALRSRAKGACEEALEHGNSNTKDN